MGRKKKGTSIVRRQPSQHNVQAKNKQVGPVKLRIADILARLDKPFADTTDYCDDENTVEYNFKPRRVFINGLCLVCLGLCKSEISCEMCKMVSYCSVEHRQDNYEEHETLCSILTELCRSEDGFQLDSILSPDKYRIFRLRLIELVEKKLSRCLELWEKEIILYPRICRICYKVCDRYCAECGVDSLCSEEEHSLKHVQWCSSFKLLRRIAQLQREHGSVKPRIPNVISNEAYQLPSHFDEVVAHLIEGTKLYDDMDTYNYAILSHLSSVPLTTLYAIQKTYEKEWRKKESLTIHIVGAEFDYECADLRLWEKMFLHFLPALKELHLVIIGPELQAPYFLLEALSTVQLCSGCAETKSIKVDFHPGKLYHEMVSLPSPNIICLFNPGLYRVTGYSTSDTWPKTIERFCKYKVPVVVTSYTEYELPQDVARIESVSSIKVLLKPQRNHFASLKPDRNFVSDHVNPLIFKNYYLAIVQGK